MAPTGRRQDLLPVYHAHHGGGLPLSPTHAPQVASGGFGQMPPQEPAPQAAGGGFGQMPPHGAPCTYFSASGAAYQEAAPKTFVSSGVPASSSTAPSSMAPSSNFASQPSEIATQVYNWPQQAHLTGDVDRAETPKGRWWSSRPVIALALAGMLIVLLVGSVVLYKLFENDHPETTTASPVPSPHPPGTTIVTNNTNSTVRTSPSPTPSPTPSPPPGPADPTTVTSTPGPDECHTFFARMNVHPEQEFAGMDDGDAWGTSQILLCTNGTMTSNSTIRGSIRDLVASHIQFVEADELDGSDGTGPPIISFCGIDDRIEKGVTYNGICEKAVDGVSRNPDVAGKLVDKYSGLGRQDSGPMVVAERVRHMRNNSERYYMNFHSVESITKWGRETCWQQGEGCRGLLRGQLEWRAQ